MIWPFGILLLLEALIFGFLANYLFERTLAETNQIYMSQFVSNLKDVTDTYISYLEDISEVVINNPDIKNFIKAEESSEPLKTGITEYLYSVKNARSDIASIILINSKGDFLSDSIEDSFESAGNYTEESWYTELSSSSSKKFYLTASHVQNLIDNEFPWVISMYRKVNNGFIVVDLNYSLIEELCSGINIGGRGYVFIVKSHN